MRYFISICLILFAFNSLGQDLSGKWTGILHQQGTPGVDFKMELEISYGFQKVLVGKGKFTRSDGAFVVERFEGQQQGGSIIITEKEVLQSSANSQWCLKTMTLTFADAKGKHLDTLFGNWYGIRVYEKGLYYDLGVNANGRTYNCQPGEASLSRPAKPKKDSTVAALPPPPLTAAPKIKKRPLDGYYEKVTVPNARTNPYATLREADAKFVKRIWREFDVREKFNNYLASPKSRLIDVLVDGVRSGQLTAYSAEPAKDDPGGDSFTMPLETSAAMATLADSALITKSDSLGNVVSSQRVAGDFNPDSVVRFRIKEDWIFDAQRSVYEPRIIGLAPLIKPKAAAGINLDLQPAFWIYFPQARPLLARKPAIINSNDGTTLSLEDVFLKRLFSSYIVKQSNDKDERIKDYTQGRDKLQEAERIKKAMQEWELDLWHN